MYSGNLKKILWLEQSEREGLPEGKLKMGSHQIIQSLTTMVSILYNIRKPGEPTEKTVKQEKLVIQVHF